MGVVITILIVVILVYAFAHNKGKKQTPVKTASPPPTPVMDTNNLPGASQPEFETIVHTRVLERKTFIKGELKSKYYGELDEQKEYINFVKEKFYDFTLYDAEINSASFRRNNDGPFPEFLSAELFRGAINPNPLPCKISYKEVSGEFSVRLYDIKFSSIEIDRKLHQVEEHEVFGTLYADVTGYILEEFTEQWEEQVAVKSIEALVELDNPGRLNAPVDSITVATKGGTATAVKKYKNYEWNHGIYQYKGKPEPGCLSTIGELLSVVMVIFLFIAMGAYGIVALLFFGLFFLLLNFFGSTLVWLFRIGLVLLCVVAVANLFNSFRSGNSKHPISQDKDDLSEVRTIRKDSAGTVDSLLIQHRIWKDYDGNQYEGDYILSLQDLIQSRLFKNKLTFTISTTPAYDKMLYYLRNEDAPKLNGLYRLFDTLMKERQLNSTEFANMVVCFVQDIPYTLILDKACDAKLYTDRATRDYLLKNSGECEGNQRFGINTPIEFLGSLKGDCDTRTLLLYTILANYNYDVAILSSEMYAHSILAIRLSVPGKAYMYKSRRYVVWETTAAGIRPGLLPEEISNFNYWRISLLSKP